MKVIELSTESRVFLDILRRQEAEDAKRYPGLHLSAIVQDICKSLYPDDFTLESSDEQRRTFYELGSAIEDLLADALRKRMGWGKPLPQQYRGVWASPDGYNSRTDTIDEIKACWKSATGFQKTGKWHGYVMQTLGYMHIFGATRARIHVMHMNGDWRPPLPWPPKTYILKPSEQEIERNWTMLEQHARDRRWLK